MKLKLLIIERFRLLEILPKEGNFVTLKSIRKLREKLSMSDDEIKKYDVKNEEEGRITWDVKKAIEPVEIEIPDFGADLIKATLRKLNDENKLKEEQFTIYEKFIEGDQSASN